MLKLKHALPILLLASLILFGAGCGKKVAEEGAPLSGGDGEEIASDEGLDGEEEAVVQDEDLNGGEEESASQPSEEDSSEATPSAEDEEDNIPEEEETIPQPPSGTVSMYKGFWMPTLFMSDNMQSMSGTAALADAGANIVLFGPTIEINTDGEVFLGNPYSNLLSFEGRLAQMAQTYYTAGIRMGLVLEIMYVESFGQGVPAGGPPPFPENAAETPGFFDDYNTLVGQLVALAEKYKLDIFSPMNEPDLKLGVAGADTWSRQILPIVTANYSGKILFKSAYAIAENAQVDYSGYDIIGADPTPGGGPNSLTEYRSAVQVILENMQSWAQRDGVPEIMFTEFGAWGGALSFTEEEKMLAHRIVFEEGQGKVQGFFALDPPPDLDRGLIGTQSLTEIKTWFKEKL